MFHSNGSEYVIAAQLSDPGEPLAQLLYLLDDPSLHSKFDGAVTGSLYKPIHRSSPLRVLTDENSLTSSKSRKEARSPPLLWHSSDNSCKFQCFSLCVSHRFEQPPMSPPG